MTILFSRFLAAAGLATVISAAVHAQIDPGMRWVSSIGITKGNSARITVINHSATQSCSGHMRFLAPGKTISGLASASFHLMPGQIAMLDLDAARVIASTAPLNERAEIGASVRFAEPPDTAKACQCGLQAVHPFSGVTTAVGDGAIVPQ